jgi:cytochrome P450
MHPPAATARTSPYGSGLTVCTPDGTNHCLDGTIIYNCNSLIRRDPSVYGDTAEVFRPERWLGDVGSVSSKIPASAWRPFERGSCSCIGQEFANIEARVIIAAIARRYDFTKVGLGELALNTEGQPMLHDTDQFVVKSQLYPVSNI